MKACKVANPLFYPDRLGNLGKSCMDVNNGDSQGDILMPTLPPIWMWLESGDWLMKAHFAAGRDSAVAGKTRWGQGWCNKAASGSWHNATEADCR
jgi:hypothetical protein